MTIPLSLILLNSINISLSVFCHGNTEGTEKNSTNKFFHVTLCFRGKALVPLITLEHITINSFRVICASVAILTHTHRLKHLKINPFCAFVPEPNNSHRTRLPKNKLFCFICVTWQNLNNSHRFAVNL